MFNTLIDRGINNIYLLICNIFQDNSNSEPQPTGSACKSSGTAISSDETAISSDGTAISSVVPPREEPVEESLVELQLKISVLEEENYLLKVIRGCGSGLFGSPHLKNIFI